MNKLFSFQLFLLSFIVSAIWAQRSHIGLPLEGTTLKLGKSFTVQVVRPNSIQGSIEVGMVIGLDPCQWFTTDPECPNPGSQLGSILFNGDFKPQFHEIPGQPYQNFTFKVPADFPKGVAQLATSRFHLIGAGPASVLEINNVTVKIV